MMILFYIATLVTGIYFLLILLFILGFEKLKVRPIRKNIATKFSVIIPFRNEALRLPELLTSIATLEYDNTLFEIIFVDDDSSDDSVNLINEFCARNPTFSIQIIDAIRSSNSPKKDAISTAINKTKYDWIITTDADCMLPPSWLTSFDRFIAEYSPNMIVAPVSFKSKTSFLEQFQLIDFLSMQGVTIGGFGIHQPFMANGANLAYKKELFLALNGFDDNNFIASGDDVFLLENFIKHNRSKVMFLKECSALVTTFPTENWQALINQRKRWAAKASHFKNNFTKFVGVLVFLANIVSAMAILLLYFEFNFIWILLVKFCIDSIIIYKTAHFYQQKIALLAYVKTLFFYPFFTVFIAVSSMLSSFEWKERKFKM